MVIILFTLPKKIPFKFDKSTRAWLHPEAVVKSGWAQTQPSYEEQYEYDIAVGTPSVYGQGWTYPALFKTENNWVLISEAGLTPDYCGTHLADKSTDGEYFCGFSTKGETFRPEDSEFPVSKILLPLGE
ncbi:MAG: glycoside hydrolase family 97 N-terminal domain-containing protein [Paludibacteraceae bacterium]